jgi:Flp pilus assembly protein TadG
MSRWRAEPGQAAIEFALTVLLFFTLVVFIMDGSRIFWNYLTVSEAAREGARYAIVHGKDSKAPVGPDGYAALQQIVQARAIGLDPALLDVVATWENNSNQRGSKVTVTVAYATQPVTTLFWSGLTLPPLTDSATMVVQN